VCTTRTFATSSKPSNRANGATPNRERRLIEKLKERRLQEFEREEARRDERELDEANARSFDKLRTG
jgi:flagellar biosynthesis chaperone FliJ